MILCGPMEFILIKFVNMKDIMWSHGVHINEVCYMNDIMWSHGVHINEVC